MEKSKEAIKRKIEFLKQELKENTELSKKEKEYLKHGIEWLQEAIEVIHV